MEIISPYVLPILEDLPKIIMHMVGLDKSMATSAKRFREISDKRQLAMYLLRRKTTRTTLEIGKLFNRDHSTVVHATKAVTDRMSVDRLFNKKVSKLLIALPHEDKVGYHAPLGVIRNI